MQRVFPGKMEQAYSSQGGHGNEDSQQAEMEIDG
jgi:hypothetical protein